MTNNPMKVESLLSLGVKVVAREPCVVRPTAHSRDYFETKSQRMKHILPALLGTVPKPADALSEAHSDAEKFVISTVPFDTSAMHLSSKL
jgi:hypothetical protein